MVCRTAFPFLLLLLINPQGMPQHRNSATITVRANDTAALRECVSDPSMRVMLFCAGGDRGLQDIAFPLNSELKVNDGDIKANMRGLKGKPGSTRPVDITNQLRLRSSNSYANTVLFTYALTDKAGSRRTRKQNSNPVVRGNLPKWHN